MPLELVTTTDENLISPEVERRVRDALARRGRAVLLAPSFSQALEAQRALAEKGLGSWVLLVCSDGFWRYVTARELVRIVHAAPSLEAAAVRLVGLARSCASPDDVTVALCRPLAEPRGGRADTCPTVI